METDAIVAGVRRFGSDLHETEIKACVRKLSASVAETLSAFANGDGGTVILGLDEQTGFVPAPGFDATAIRDALAGMCADRMEPPLRLAIALEDFEGATIVRADVPELDPVEKPCFVKERGAYAGSFIRAGDGDRRLTHYEVSQLLTNREQPRHDRRLVEEASVADLDTELVQMVLVRARGRSRRAFAELDDEDALARLGVLARDEQGVLHPTLGGLLCVGTYPQQFFPQLFVSLVALPGLTMGETSPDGKRFLDNHTITGPIPRILEDVGYAATRNMRTAAIIHGLGREDRHDYPLEVIRELVVNALMHRDYSPEGWRTQVQIEIYPDRLVVKNPGGLFGDLTVDALGAADQVSTSRNELLAALLTDLSVPHTTEPICENRGSGLPGVLAELRRVGMSPPEFDVSPARTVVTVPQAALLSPEVHEWIESLGLRGLGEAELLALAMMRHSGRATKAMLSAWGVAGEEASRALRDLVERGVARRAGGRRYATYSLVSTAPALFELQVDKPQATPGVEADLDAILESVRAGKVTTRALSEHLDIAPRTLARRIEELVRRGRLEPTKPSRSSRQTYRIVERGETP